MKDLVPLLVLAAGAAAVWFFWPKIAEAAEGRKTQPSKGKEMDVETRPMPGGASPELVNPYKRRVSLAYTAGSPAPAATAFQKKYSAKSRAIRTVPQKTTASPVISKPVTTTITAAASKPIASSGVSTGPSLSLAPKPISTSVAKPAFSVSKRKF